MSSFACRGQHQCHLLPGREQCSRWRHHRGKKQKVIAGALDWWGEGSSWICSLAWINDGARYCTIRPWMRYRTSSFGREHLSSLYLLPTHAGSSSLRPTVDGSFDSSRSRCTFTWFALQGVIHLFEAGTSSHGAARSRQRARRKALQVSGRT